MKIGRLPHPVGKTYHWHEVCFANDPPRGNLRQENLDNGGCLFGGLQAWYGLREENSARPPLGRVIDARRGVPLKH